MQNQNEFHSIFAQYFKELRTFFMSVAKPQTNLCTPLKKPPVSHI